MPLYYCDIQGCREPAERYCGACDLCGRHVCVAHVDKDHNCPGASVEGVGVMKAIEKMWIEDVQRLNARIDLEALCQHASTLRDGIPCSTLPVLVKESMAIGHKNWHFPITFDDGVVWLCRTPHTTARAAPPVIQDRILLSEFATYRFLSSIDVPVPAVFGVAVSSPTNAVGVSYLLMEKVPGKWVDWDTAGVEGKERIMEQIADVYIKIKAHPFPSIGALLDTSSGDTMFPVGPFVERGQCNLDDDGNAITIGPFSTTLDYFKGVLQHKLDLIVHRELLAKSAVDGYLLYRFLLDNVSSLPPVKNATDGGFYLVHGGSKADNILADEKYAITGIIDWECSEVLPASSAFSAPLFLMDWHRVDNGENEPSEGENRLAEILEAKGHPDLARRVLETRFENYWVFGVQSGGWIGPRSALGMLKLCGEECGGSVDEAGWAAWKEKIMHRYADDVGLQSLLRGP
ncbi:hypothetical protein OF83DRAFT_696377 [Amylostereum chailletii]|nr:hypothetical protein OF83DRAFT_696377 [Amylostereum chailletii]